MVTHRFRIHCKKCEFLSALITGHTESIRRQQSHLRKCYLALEEEDIEILEGIFNNESELFRIHQWWQW